MKLLRKGNRGNIIMKEERMQIRFEGDNTIDIETLSAALNATVDTLKDITDNIISDDEFCKFKVVSFEKGSFVVDIVKIITENKESIMTIFENGVTTLLVFEAILSIRQHLKGREPKSIKNDGNDVLIENLNGNIINVNIESFNVYVKDDKIEKNLSKMCDAVAKESDRSGIEFKINENLIKYTPDEVRVLSTPIDVEKMNDKMREDIVETMVTVHKPDLIGKSKWSLYMQSQSIKAEVADEKIRIKLKEKKVSFTNGTRMRVKMRIRYKINDAGLPDNKKKSTYTVLEVYQVDVDDELINIDDL